MLKRILSLAVVALVMTACNQGTDSPADAALTIEDLQPKFAEMVGQEVIVQGTVDHVCKHGGGKMVIFGESMDNKIKVFAEESGNFVADEVEGMNVVVTGIVDEFRIDETYLQEMEADILNAEAELTAEVDTTATTEEVAVEGEKKKCCSKKEAEGKSEEELKKCCDEKKAEGAEEAKKCAHEEGENHEHVADKDSEYKKHNIESQKKQLEGLKAQLEEAKAEGKDYIAFYSVKCKSYTVLEGGEDNHEGHDHEGHDHDHEGHDHDHEGHNHE